MEKLKRRLNRLAWTRLGKSCLWGAVVLFTGIVLAYQVANWGGTRTWAKAEAMLEENGETLDFLELAPNPGPPGENFGALPALDGIGVVEGGDSESGPGAALRKRLESLRLSTNKAAKRPGGGKGDSFALGQRRDLEAWVKYLEEGGRFSPPENSMGAARDILEALAAADELVAELSSGLERERAVLVPRWENNVPANPFEMQLPHFQSLQAATQFFSLRATAAGRAGEEEKALESILMGLKFSRLAATDGLLISVLVANANLQMTLDALWEGLDAQVYSAESLRRIRAELAKFDFREMVLVAMRTEMAAGAGGVEWAKGAAAGHLVGAVAEGESSGGVAGLAVRLAPEGWFDRNKATIVNWNYDYYIEPLKSGSLLDVIEGKEEVRAQLRAAKEGFDPHSFIARMLFPAYEKVAGQLFYVQSVVDLAVAACAVEAYRTERDAYPRNLESLVPDYLDAVPVDRLSPGGNKPLRYLRYVEGGRCRIWSVGWDHEDDGGSRAQDEEKAAVRRFGDPEFAGDWVWSYTPD